MNKKASHFLNATERIIIFLLIGVSLILLLVSGVISKSNLSDDVVELESDFLTTQALRTIAQSPLIINDQQVQFSDALNYYYKLLYLKPSTIDNRLKRLTILASLQEFTQTTMSSFLSTNEAIYAQIYFQNVALENSRVLLFEGEKEPKDTSPFIVSKNKEQFIILPAKLDIKGEKPGDYIIKIIFETK